MDKSDIKYLAVGLVLAGIALAYFLPSKSGDMVVVSESAGAPLDLKTTDKQSIYDELSDENKVLLRRSVQYFCAIEYDEDSCIHHMITCGKKCMTYINEETQLKVKKAYFKRKLEMEASN